MENMLLNGEQMDLQSTNLEESPLEPAVGSSQAPSRSTQMSELPDICIAIMFACLSPIEVAKLACVSRSFYNASCSDLVWESFLSLSYHKLLALQPNPPPQFASKKEVFDYLCKPFVTSNHIQGYWLDRRTGGLSMSLSASGLDITWSDTPRYWEWLEDRSSMFPLVAELRNVCWFEAKGEIECILPPGDYTLSWRMLFLDTFVGWDVEPAHFKFSKNNGTETEFKCYMQQRQQPLGITAATTTTSSSMPVVPGYKSPTIRVLEDEWREFDSGEFTVERGEEATLLTFCMLEINGGRWKRGLRMDGVVVRPSNTISPSLPSSTNTAQPRLLPRQHNRGLRMDWETLQRTRT